MAKNTGGFTWRGFISLLSFVAVVCIGLALLIARLGGGNLASLLRRVSEYIGYAVVIVTSYYYAYSRRHWAYLLIWLICVALIVIFLII